jgi:hypothetical protein
MVELKYKTDNFEYPGYFPGRGGACKLQVWEQRTRSFTNWVVIVTEKNDNPGPSITNAIENIARELSKLPYLVDNDFVLIENYRDEYDHVTFKDVDFSSPVWRRIYSGSEPDPCDWFDLSTVAAC